MNIDGGTSSCASDRSSSRTCDNPPPAKKLRHSFKFDRKEKENWKPLQTSVEQYQEAIAFQRKLLQNRQEEAQLWKDTEKYKNEIEKEILAIRKYTKTLQHPLIN